MLLEYGAQDAGSSGWHCIMLAAERGHTQVRSPPISLAPPIIFVTFPGCLDAATLRQQRQHSRLRRVDSASGMCTVDHFTAQINA